MWVSGTKAKGQSIKWIGEQFQKLVHLIRICGELPFSQNKDRSYECLAF